MSKEDDFDFEGSDEPLTVPVNGLTKRELADATGYPLNRIDKLVREGLPAIPAQSKRAGLRFDLPAVIEWVAEHRAAQRGGADDTTAGAKRRLAIAQAEKLETANKVAQGEFFVAAEVRASITENIARIRESLLTIPTRVSAPVELQAEIRAEIVSAINALSFDHGGDNGAA